MNVWTFSGNCAADAELRTTNTGDKVLSFRVANKTGFGDREHTQWVSCSYWGKRAESVAQYVRKGDRITVSGELKLGSYTNKQGVETPQLTVRVNDLDLAARADSGGQQRQDQGGGYGGKPIPPDHERPPEGSRGGGVRGGGKPAFDQDLDDEIPF